MNLSNYILERGGTAKIACPVVASLAGSSECSAATLYMIARGHKQPSPKLARRIETATAGAVQASELRPDVFHS